MSKQPTIKDVARLAGVSISTVSRVMNKSKPVSPKAERKVLDAIDKLGFKPNELARSLVMRKSRSIGILVKDIAIDYMAQMIRGAEEIGRMYDYDILLSSTYGEFELEKKAVDFLYRKQVEGIIVISENIAPDIIIKIKEYHIPYLLMDPYYKVEDYPTVTVDYKKAMRELCDYVYSLGNRRLIYLASNADHEPGRTKIQAFRDYFQKKEDCVTTTAQAEGTDRNAGYRAAESMHEEILDRRYDIVICENDALAVGILNYCYDHHLYIPDQLQVTGFGGSDMASIVRPTLTSMHQPYYDIGAVAMRLLTKALAEDKTEEDQVEELGFNRERGSVIAETVFLPTQIAEGHSTQKLN